jgi:hypothetical protein
MAIVGFSPCATASFADGRPQANAQNHRETLHLRGSLHDDFQTRRCERDKRDGGGEASAPCVEKALSLDRALGVAPRSFR